MTEELEKIKKDKKPALVEKPKAKEADSDDDERIEKVQSLADSIKKMVKTAKKQREFSL